MNKYLKIVLGFFIFIIFILIIRKSPEEKIKDYLKDKYKEEFVIEYMGKRNGAIRAEVLPKKYLGTIREYDSYYSSTVFVPSYGELGDNYGGVLLKESANEYFRPKLEELFGKNILPVLTLEGGYEYSDFKKEMSIRQNEFKKDPKGRFFPLSGGIYIFGRVENEKDREFYRKQIYEFIQYLKAEEMFDYVDVVVTIYDERSLVNSYSKVLALLKEAKSTEKNSDDYKKKRSKILEPLIDDFKALKEIEIQKKLKNIIKSNMLGKNGWTNEYSYSQIYHKSIRSPKFIQTNSFPSIREYKAINYNKIEELKLLDSMKIDYKEYDDKALKRGEWGD